tara:strand:- start:3326 stop:4333 length:1008 start_codon:yes stop_codon:yes gene_type:complete
MSHTGQETVNNNPFSAKSQPFETLPFKIASLGFGTSQLPMCQQENNVKNALGQDAREILYTAIDNGINFFDTAPSYGKSESLLGEIGRTRRRKIIIATKAGLKSDGTRDFSIPFLESQLEKSLSALNCDYLDLFQLNKPSPEMLADGELFYFLDTLKKKGKIRFSGVIIGDVETGYQCIESGKVDCVQVLYNLLYQDTERLINNASKYGLGIIIRSPLNSGILAGTFTNNKTFHPNDKRSVFFSGATIKQRLNLLHKIQKELNVQDSKLLEFSLRFVLSNWENAVIIPAASKLSQLKRLLEFGSNYSPLAQVEMDKIKKTVSKYMEGISMEYQSK